MKDPKVLILMGSKSDLPIVEKTSQILTQFGIAYEMHVSSAHRSPKKTANLVCSAKERGIQMIICAAGKAAHLAGVTAAHTALPVFGIPIPTSLSGGLDSLLSTVQMPSGTPVGTFGTGNAGATNAGLFAVQVLALQDEQLQKKFIEYKQQLEQEVEECDAQLQKEIR